MTAPEVAKQIRMDAFLVHEPAILAPTLASAARILAAGLAARVDAILKGKPWWWRFLFGRGLEFAIDVLDEVARQITRDYAKGA